MRRTQLQGRVASGPCMRRSSFKVSHICLHLVSGLSGAQAARVHRENGGLPCGIAREASPWERAQRKTPVVGQDEQDTDTTEAEHTACCGTPRPRVRQTDLQAGNLVQRAENGRSGEEYEQQCGKARRVRQPRRALRFCHVHEPAQDHTALQKSGQVRCVRTALQCAITARR